MLFEPFEIKATRRDIEAFLRADNGLCIDQVRDGALSLVRDKDKVLYSIRIDRMKTDQLALILIYNVLTRHLQHGNFHIYRGTLSGTGQDMLRLWHATAKELIRRGYSSPNEYETDTAGIMDEIRAAG